jgi:hypothetical protein
VVALARVEGGFIEVVGDKTGGEKFVRLNREVGERPTRTRHGM